MSGRAVEAWRRFGGIILFAALNIILGWWLHKTAYLAFSYDSENPLAVLFLTVTGQGIYDHSPRSTSLFSSARAEYYVSLAAYILLFVWFTCRKKEGFELRCLLCAILPVIVIIMNLTGIGMSDMEGVFSEFDRFKEIFADRFSEGYAWAFVLSRFSSLNFALGEFLAAHIIASAVHFVQKLTERV